MINNIDTIIYWLMSGLISIISLIVGYFIAKDKYIFQKIYDRELVLIADLYKQIVRLEFAIKKYVHFIGADLKQEVINEKIESLRKIKENFHRFQHKFWEVEIILDENIIIEIEKFLRKYIEIASKLSVSFINQQLGDYEQAFTKWDESFVLVSSDLVQIKDGLKKEFRKIIRRQFLFYRISNIITSIIKKIKKYHTNQCSQPS